MKLDREVVLTRGMILIGVLAIIATIVFMSLFVVYRLEKDNGEVTVTPTPAVVSPDAAPVATPEVTEAPFDSNLDLGIDIITRLTDNDSSNDQITSSFARNNFLKMLASQIGSTGEIIGGGLSTYKYYTEWYIDGYPEDRSWNENTPWCASYISWCLEQVNLSLRTTAPRYANVDNFILHFEEDNWLVPAMTPTPGDLVFFGVLNNPNHMGVVIAVEGGYVYTIEGNANDVVGVRKYRADDGSILGYGVLNWTN